MREAKFRGQIDDKNWVCGYYFNITHKTGEKPKHYIIPNYASAIYGIEVNPETVGQYIGRKDCKDNDLFDGDIVQSTYTKDIGIIKHGEFRDEGILQVDQDFYKFDDEDIRKSYGFFVEFEDGQCAIDNKTQIWLEKIGNIHQNPELLEGK